MKKLNDNEITERLSNLNGWEFKNGSIAKAYQFRDFKEAFSIMTRIAFECEALNHHPNWENVYNSLTIRLNTHDVNGITENDFDLAKTIDSIVDSY